ncbi:MAG: radical SAM protein [bacterium]
MAACEPIYLETARKGLLLEKVNAARRILTDCSLCPRNCRVDRCAGELGECETGEEAVVSSFNAHFGEEAPLVGAYGSGTIFFTHCSLKCNFCQNFDISHQGEGDPFSVAQLASTMLILQKAGCHNINLVTPTHVVPQILSAVYSAIDGGLSIPLVYNSSGYENVETLRLLEGVIDIYMPDFKFWDPAVAALTCQAPDYPEAARRSLKEMHRQVGDLQISAAGLAERGVIIRHLVLPEGLAGTRPIMDFIVKEISADSYVNLMDQYRPCGNAHQVSGLARPLSRDQFQEALQDARAAGIRRLA